jgi:tetratricopeptide (TPR) repeat protein
MPPVAGPVASHAVQGGPGVGLVGREQELDRLTAAVERFFTGAGGALFIEGPAGVGKTTLANALIERVLAEVPDAAIARGRCLQAFESGEPYLPFIDAIRDLSDESTSGFVGRSTIAGLFRELAPYWLSVVPLVGNLLSATFATATEVQGRFRRGGAPSREALFVQYLDFVRRLAAEHRVLLFLDDLHWADHSSLALLAYITRGIATLPVAVVGTMRNLAADQDDPALAQTLLELERESLAGRTTLGELDERTLDVLLEGVLEGEVSDGMTRWIFRTAGGNPLFASELARLLIANGGAVNVNGEWHLTDAAEHIDVPRSAEAVIEKRLHRLDADELNLLQYASVDGNEFDSAVLSRVMGKDELELLDALEKLDRQHGLVSSAGEVDLPDGDIASVYRFRHALVQTVLYRQVVGKRRILLHRKAGDVLEQLWSDSADRVAGRLARHFHEGRRPDRAYRYARTAADSAASVFANWEAIEFLRIALASSDQPDMRAPVEERLGDVLRTVGHYEEGIASLHSAIEHASDDADRRRLARKIAVLDRLAGLATPLDLRDRLVALLEKAKEPRERCRLLVELARLPGISGISAYAADAVAIAETLDEPLLLADALERLAVARLFVEGNVELALSDLDRALEVAETINDPVLLAYYHNIAGVARAKLGHYRDALVDFRHALGEAERIGDSNAIGAGCTNLGMVMLRLGTYDDAARMLERAHTIHERRDRGNVVASLFGLAERARLAGDIRIATMLYTRLLERATALKQEHFEAIAHAGIGLCHLGSDRLDDARAAADDVRRTVARRSDFFEDRDIVEVFLARLDAADGRIDEAVDRLEKAAAELRARDVYLWARTELDRVRLIVDTDPAGAATLLDHVTAETAGVQSPPIEAEARTLRTRLAS